MQPKHMSLLNQFQEEVIKVFKGTVIKVTTDGHEMLGSTIGATSFTEEYTAHKVKDFVEEIENLSQIAERAYAALTLCIMGKWRYIMRTMADTNTLFQPLEDVITQMFIPALTGRCQCNPDERRLLSLSIRYGGLNIINLVISASRECQASQKISEPLKD